MRSARIEIWTWTLALLGVAGLVACGPRHEYTSAVPQNLVLPPEWTAHPFRLNGDGSIDVVGRSFTDDMVLAQSQAELDARVRLARVLVSAAEQLGQREGSSTGTVGSMTQAEAGAERAKASVAGAMPVDLWYDKKAGAQYVRMRMTKARWSALYSKYDPTLAERTVRDMGTRLTLP